MVTRFAPSPTGYLHLGHAYSALMCQKVAGDGRFLLRFEDIDHTRVRAHYYEALLEDLAWLGVTFSETPWKQAERMSYYEQALEDLIQRDLVYPCFCTRKELAVDSTLNAPQGEGSPLYSGKCRKLSERNREVKREQGVPYAWRLDAERVSALVGELSFTEEGKGRVSVSSGALGDVILARKDIKTSYHIAVVVDDAAQGVTDVVRGEDLRESTHVHRLLQELWGYSAPRYFHHRLICDAEGKRLAKRDDALAVRTLREAGVSPDEVISMVSPLEG